VDEQAARIMRELRDSVARGDLAASGRLLCDALSAGVGPDSALLGLADVAARGLQLHYATPHVLIALLWTLETLPTLPAREARILLDADVRHVTQSPKVGLEAVEPLVVGEPWADDDAEGLRRSIDSHRAFDAWFYLLRMRAAAPQALGSAVLALAANEVDELGHVFIYAATALRLMERSEEAARPAVLLALAEFLQRRAVTEPPAQLDERHSLAELVPHAFERINVLGHNVIYAAELRRTLDRFDAGVQAHLLGQLARNIERSDVSWTTDAYRDAAARAPADGGADPPAEMLERAFAAGDLPAAARTLADAWPGASGRDQLRRTLLALFARIDTPQPHYLIYPAATFRLLDLVGDAQAELGVAQLVKMGVEAAAEHGLRPAHPSG
jgi:hypothetical protein